MLPFANRLYGMAQICFVAGCVQADSRAFNGKVLTSMSLAFRFPDFRLISSRLMMGGIGALIAAVVLLSGAPAARAQAGGDVSGIWLTQAGDAKVRVSKCNGGICGVIVWLKTPIDPATGKPAVDDKNPTPALAKRPMIGLPLFSGMRLDGDNRWSGQIYNADDGNSYVSHISVAGPDALRVEGCVGMLCGGETWSRAGK